MAGSMRRVFLVSGTLLGFSLLAVSFVLMSRDADEGAFLISHTPGESLKLLDPGKAPDIAYADEASHLQEVFSDFGATVAYSREDGVPTYEIAIDRMKFMRAIPSLQAKEILSPELTATDARRRQNSLAIYCATYMSATTLESLYRFRGETGNMKIATFLMDPDESGHPLKRELFQFTFTRDLFDKIDWDNFQIKNLPKVTPGYREGPWLQEAMKHEPE
jgi:hypothetical protein